MVLAEYPGWPAGCAGGGIGKNSTCCKWGLDNRNPVPGALGTVIKLLLFNKIF
jgi:hypothetical protein